MPHKTGPKIRECHMPEEKFLSLVQANNVEALTLWEGSVDKIIDEGGNHALLMAVQSAVETTIIHLLVSKFKLDLEHVNAKGETAFICAARKGNLSHIKVLFTLGANTQHRNNVKETALMVSSRFSLSAETITWLLALEVIGHNVAAGVVDKFEWLCNEEILLSEDVAEISLEGLNKTLRKNNHSEEALLVKGWLLSCLKQYGEAQKVFDALYQLNPAHPLVAYNLAYVAFKRDNIGKAIEHYYQALRNAPLNRAILLPSSPNFSTFLRSSLLPIQHDLCVTQDFSEEKQKEHPGMLEKEELFAAVRRGDLLYLKTHSTPAVDFTVVGGHGHSLLQLACSLLNYHDKLSLYRRLTVVSWLLDERGISLSHEGQGGLFLKAIQSGWYTLAREFASRGASVTACDAAGNTALHLACSDGNALSDRLKIIAWLVDDLGISVNARNEEGFSAFLLLAKYGVRLLNEQEQLSGLKLLVSKGAAIKATDLAGNNALHWLCRELFSSSRTNLIVYLIEELKIPPYARNKANELPLHCAAKSSSLEIIKIFYHHTHALVNEAEWARVANCVMARVSSDKREILSWWATRGNFLEQSPLAMEYLLEMGNISMIKANCVSKPMSSYRFKLEATALHVACRQPYNTELVRWLLNAKVDVNAVNQEGVTPFMVAAGMNGLNTLQLLLQYGANPQAVALSNQTALHLACYNKADIKTITWLLQIAPTLLEKKCKLGRTPLLYAVHNKVEVVEYLRGHNANVNAVDNQQDNILHSAAKFGHSDIIRLIINKGWHPIEKTNQHGKTAFLIAAEVGNFNVLSMLQELGANLNAVDAAGRSALHLACRYKGSIQVIDWLLDVAQLSLESKARGVTPLLMAMMRGDLPLIKALILKGADISATDYVGRGIVNYAASPWRLDAPSVPNESTLSWVVALMYIGEPFSLVKVNNFDWMSRRLVGLTMQLKGYVAGGIYKRAIEGYNLLLKENPQSIEALVKKGWCLNQLGKYQDAITCFLEALKQSPNHLNALCNLGWAWQHIKQHQKAVNVFNQVLNIHSEHDYALKRRDFSAAVLNKDSFKAVLSAHRLMCECREFPDIQTYFVELVSDNEAALASRAMCWQQQHQFTLAQELYEVLISYWSVTEGSLLEQLSNVKASKLAQYLNERGTIFYLLGDYKAALQQYEKGLFFAQTKAGCLGKLFSLIARREVSEGEVFMEEKAQYLNTCLSTLAKGFIALARGREKESLYHFEEAGKQANAQETTELLYFKMRTFKAWGNEIKIQELLSTHCPGVAEQSSLLFSQLSYLRESNNSPFPTGENRQEMACYREAPPPYGSVPNKQI